MKKKIFILLVTQLIIFSVVNSQESINAEITYIGNNGFLISNNDKKIFIDALYEDSDPTIKNVDGLLEKMIMNGSKPFENSQLFLVSHNHPDHYSSTYVSKYLKNNPQSRLVGPSGVVSSTGGQRIKANPQKYKTFDTTVNDIQITAYNLLHIIFSRIPNNVGYFADLDGFKIFHAGDNAFEDTTEFATYKLYEKNIDVAFLLGYQFYTSQKQRDMVKRLVNPKYIVLMHMNYSEATATKQYVKALNESKTYPQMIVFRESMEKVRVNDSIAFINLMPEKVANMKDTTIMINAPISIKVPFIFHDPDLNDSLSYFVSGLPSGLKFDSSSMNIFGSTDKAGKYPIKIIARDTSLCVNSTIFKIIVKNNTQISNENQKRIYFYPNPANDKISINNVMSTQVFIQIFDLNGKLVLNKQIDANSIDISNLSKGIYIIKLIDSENVLINKLIKE